MSDTSIQHISSCTDFSPCPPCSRAHCFCLRDLCLVFFWISTDAYTWLRAASRNPYVHIQTVITVIMPVALQHYCYRINRKRVKFCIRGFSEKIHEWDRARWKSLHLSLLIWGLYQGFEATLAQWWSAACLRVSLVSGSEQRWLTGMWSKAKVFWPPAPQIWCGIQKSSCALPSATQQFPIFVSLLYEWYIRQTWLQLALLYWIYSDRQQEPETFCSSRASRCDTE